MCWTRAEKNVVWQITHQYSKQAQVDRAALNRCKAHFNVMIEHEEYMKSDTWKLYSLAAPFPLIFPFFSSGITGIYGDLMKLFRGSAWLERQWKMAEKKTNKLLHNLTKWCFDNNAHICLDNTTNSSSKMYSSIFFQLSSVYIVFLLSPFTHILNGQNGSFRLYFVRVLHFTLNSTKHAHNTLTYKNIHKCLL